MSRRVGDYIEFDHANFSILFDGGLKLKMRMCDINSCGLCNIRKYSKVSYLKYLSPDRKCSV